MIGVADQFGGELRDKQITVLTGVDVVTIAGQRAADFGYGGADEIAVVEQPFGGSGQGMIQARGFGEASVHGVEAGLAIAHASQDLIFRERRSAAMLGALARHFRDGGGGCGIANGRRLGHVLGEQENGRLAGTAQGFDDGLDVGGRGGY